MTPYDNNFWLDIDYLQASRAAQYCSAQFTALLYAEIWCATNKYVTNICSRNNCIGDGHWNAFVWSHLADEDFSFENYIFLQKAHGKFHHVTYSRLIASEVEKT